MAATLPHQVVANLNELERLRKEQDTVIRKINKIHSKLSETLKEDPDRAEKLPEKLWAKLRSFYEEANALAINEERVAAQCVRALDARIAGTGSGGLQRR